MHSVLIAAIIALAASSPLAPRPTPLLKRTANPHLIRGGFPRLRLYYKKHKRKKNNLPSNSVGANVEEASSGGMESAEAAARLKDLPLDFSEAVESAKNAVRDDPGVPGWGTFEEVHERHMRNVSYHADTLGKSIQGSAYQIALSDLEAAEQFEGSIGAPQLY